MRVEPPLGSPSVAVHSGGGPALIALCGSLFAVVFAVRLTIGNDLGEGIISLYAIPIAMLAAVFGRGAGLAAGLLGCALIGAWIQVQSVEMSAIGFGTRAATLIGIGLLVGHFSATRNAQLRDLIARLDHLAHTDELTNLPNRRAWEQALERDLARAEREQNEFAVAILDLDRFKSYNDIHGHQRGDELLRSSAAAWKHLVRRADLIARIGGEEFAILLSEPGDDAAIEEMMDRVRAAVPDGETCSIGVARWDGSESAGQLVRRADDALYRAKNAGRDRVISAEVERAGG